MYVEFKFMPTEQAQEMMAKIVSTIYEKNKEMFQSHPEIEAVWFIRYTSRTPEKGEVVLRFQRDQTGYDKLIIPALSEDEDDMIRNTEKYVGPMKHIIWTESFRDVFDIFDGKGMNARVRLIQNNSISL